MIEETGKKLSMATGDMKQWDIGYDRRREFWILLDQLWLQDFGNLFNEVPGIECVNDIAMAGEYTLGVAG